MDSPRRREVLELTVQGDSAADVASMLRHIALEYERGKINVGCSGGYDSGAIWKRSVNPDQTHDNYVKEIGQYLERVKAEKLEEEKL